MSSQSPNSSSVSTDHEAQGEGPAAGFGPNEWLVDEIYQQYLQDRDSVDRAWWDFFADYKPDGSADSAAAPGQGGASGAAARATSPDEGSAVGAAQPVPAGPTSPDEGSAVGAAQPVPAGPAG
ncbi:2-oxoglutarate dehydrogenase E1 subunit family protein, partial [Streptomyces sp. CBMA29]|uniref:2-oxoglutarate dehydrogenase E1 subunit family protein n=1 Tax=Streptomyces sp. CBMA29 TaxID=1896314 RepID=UPI001661ED75